MLLPPYILVQWSDKSYSVSESTTWKLIKIRNNYKNPNVALQKYQTTE